MQEIGGCLLIIALFGLILLILSIKDATRID